MFDILTIDDKIVMQFAFFAILFLTLLTIGFYLIDPKSHRVKYLVYGNVAYTLMHAFVLLTINTGVSTVEIVAFLDLMGITLYIIAFFTLLNMKIYFKRILLFNSIHLITIAIVFMIFKQISMVRAITSLFILYSIIYASVRGGKNKDFTSIKSFYNVFLNLIFLIGYRISLIITRIYTFSNNVEISNLNTSIVIFTLVLLAVIFWTNFSLLFVNYDLLNSSYRHLSHYDFLTNIPNRRYAHLHINHALSNVQQKDFMYAIVMIDIDNFKEYNDKYGHSFGDEVLVEFASELGGLVRSDDLLSRYGGDEFLLLLKIRKHEELTYFTNRVDLHFTRSTLTSKDIRVKFSTGKIIIDKDSKFDIDQLIDLVDNAMYFNKKQ